MLSGPEVELLWWHTFSICWRPSTSPKIISTGLYTPYSAGSAEGRLHRYRETSGWLLDHTEWQNNTRVLHETLGKEASTWTLAHRAKISLQVQLPIGAAFWRRHELFSVNDKRWQSFPILYDHLLMGEELLFLVCASTRSRLRNVSLCSSHCTRVWTKSDWTVAYSGPSSYRK